MDEKPVAESKSSVPPIQPPAPKVPEALNATPAKPATEQQLRNVEQQMTGFERSTLRWTKVAVILSGIAAILICAQWWEMHSGGVDTAKLAQAAVDQATALKLQEQNMETLAATGTVQAGASVEAANAATSASDTAKKTLELSTKSFKQEQRAYISTTTFVNVPFVASLHQMNQVPIFASMFTCSMLEEHPP